MVEKKKKEDVKSNHVTKAEANIFEDLGFNKEDAKHLKSESNYKINKELV